MRANPEGKQFATSAAVITRPLLIRQSRLIYDFDQFACSFSQTTATRQMGTRWAQRPSPSGKVQPKWSRLGWTQVRTAEEFGIDRSYISDMERGKKTVCLPTMEVLAQGFAISLSQLVRGLDRELPGDPDALRLRRR